MLFDRPLGNTHARGHFRITEVFEFVQNERFATTRRQPPNDFEQSGNGLPIRNDGLGLPVIAFGNVFASIVARFLRALAPAWQTRGFGRQMTHRFEQVSALVLNSINQIAPGQQTHEQLLNQIRRQLSRSHAMRQKRDEFSKMPLVQGGDPGCMLGHGDRGQAMGDGFG